MAKSEEDELGESMGNARAKDLGGKTMRVSRAKAREVVVAETKADPMAKPSEDEVAEAREERWTEIEADGGGEAKEDHVVDNGDTFQKIGIEQFESSTTAARSFLDVFQAIAAEASDYSRRSLEHGSSFVEKLFGATSFEKAVLIQSEYARTSYVGLITYLRKMGELYANLAKEGFKPIEAAITKFQANE